MHKSDGREIQKKSILLFARFSNLHKELNHNQLEDFIYE